MDPAFVGFVIMYGLFMTLLWLAQKGKNIRLKKANAALEAATQPNTCSCGHTTAFHNEAGKCKHTSNTTGRECGCQRCDALPRYLA